MGSVSPGTRRVPEYGPLPILHFVPLCYSLYLNQEQRQGPCLPDSGNLRDVTLITYKKHMITLLTTDPRGLVEVLLPTRVFLVPS